MKPRPYTRENTRTHARTRARAKTAELAFSRCAYTHTRSFWRTARITRRLGSSPTSGPVAQWIRHRPTELGIAGSSPAGVMYCPSTHIDADIVPNTLRRELSKDLRVVPCVHKRWQKKTRENLINHCRKRSKRTVSTARGCRRTPRNK